MTGMRFGTSLRKIKYLAGMRTGEMFFITLGESATAVLFPTHTKHKQNRCRLFNLLIRSDNY